MLARTKPGFVFEEDGEAGRAYKLIKTNQN